MCKAEEALVPLFLIERNFAEIVKTDPETMAIVKQVNDEIVHPMAVLVPERR
jgi:hypothetical protein